MNTQQPPKIDAEDAFLRPFEWLTDSASVIPLIHSVISSLEHPAKILHVGSGSSVLAEHLLEKLGNRIEHVANIDKDMETLLKMEKRWQSAARGEVDKLEFLPVDFATHELEPIPYPPGHFDLAIDKSTLDCTLCSDSATAGLLSEVYRLLNPEGGTYIVISFHHIDLLQPLMENMPGADWEVSHTIMKRQVEDLIGKNTRGNQSQIPIEQPAATEELENKANSEQLAARGGAWASGSFEPDELYRRTVNVLICRRRGSGVGTCSTIDRETLKEHVNATNDTWYRSNNPMLTLQRKQTILKLFEEHKPSEGSEAGIGLYDLQSSYQILFTEAEREHLDYEFFLEDWQAWIADQKDSALHDDKMSVETALAFLEEMQ